MVSPSKHRAALGLLAMHKPPVKFSTKSGSSARKKLSFATFQNYNVCMGYRYPATADCIVTTKIADYNIPANERVVIHPPPPADFQWTMASPPIIFGTVSSLLVRERRDLCHEQSSIASSMGLSLGRTSGSSNSHDGPSATVVSHKPISPSSPVQTLSGPLQDILDTQEASNAFNTMVDNMVEGILTCQKCSLVGHFEKNYPSNLICLACSRLGHKRRDCEKIAIQQGLFQKQKYPLAPPIPNTGLEVVASSALPLARDPSCSPVRPAPSSHISSPPKPPFGSPRETPPPPLQSPPPSTKPMAVFAIDPHWYVPAGQHIIDGGAARLPRTFVTPPSPIVHRHEEYMVAEVMPLPPLDQLGPAREAVVDFLENRGVQVRPSQPWVCGVGLFRLCDAGVRFPLLQLPPQLLGNDTFMRFHKHDEGVGFRGTHGFCDGCLMFLGIPLDLRTTENICAIVSTFRKFQDWVSDDPYLVRSIVFASFPEDILVPRDVVFTDYAPYGGAKVS